jgi:ABC-type polysaccharide/polyol phosphate transport system ATPase subunit
MASITLENVTVDFPVYGLQKSLRKVLFSRVVGGVIAREEANNRISVRAINNLSITLKNGDRFGLMGHNGAGKTTLLRVFAGIYPPSSGRILIKGRVSTLFNTSPGLDFEDTGYENIYTCGMFLGMSQDEITAKLPDIEQFSELGEYLNLPVRTYSTGMLMRLGFAVATTIDPDILVLDEGLSAGDARFAESARRRVETLIKRTNILIVASHSDVLIKQMCNRVLLLDHGNVVADGPPDQVIEKYHEMVAQAAANPPPPPVQLALPVT